MWSLNISHNYVQDCTEFNGSRILISVIVCPTLIINFTIKLLWIQTIKAINCLPCSSRSVKSQCWNVSRISNQFKKIELWLAPPEQHLGNKKIQTNCNDKKPSFEFFADVNCPFEQNGDTIQNYMKKSRFAASN